MKKIKLMILAGLLISSGFLVAQQSVPPPPCDDCQYKQKQVPCLRGGFINGEPYVFLGDKTKCVDGTGGCVGSDCNP